MVPIILIDGKKVKGVQSINYKISKNRQNVHSIDSDKRIGSDYPDLFITGSIEAKSEISDLDKRIYETTPELKPFQIVLELQDNNINIKKITFDECYLEDKTFAMDANEVAITTYQFGSTRVKED
jgi:hypothetical protein